MFLSQLSLQNFRSYSSHQFTFQQLTTLIVGPNAQGKTSILEAIELLATGNSFRADKVEEMITLGAELSRVNATVRSTLVPSPENDDTQLEVLLTRGEVQGKRTQSRLYSVNTIRRQKRVFTGNILTVSFRPEDMRLVEGSPARRRAFLDKPLSLLSQEYDHALRTYGQALIRRNKLLTQIREGEQTTSSLTYWNATLLKYGEIIHHHRQRFLDSFVEVEFPVEFTVEYLHSTFTQARLAHYQPREIAAGHTLIGPHKDDFSVQFPLVGQPEPVPVALYGSRGQQRMGVLWLKMAELHFVHAQTGRHPLLLLDDILSELDHDHREHVLQLVGEQQTLVTTTEPAVLAFFQHGQYPHQVLDLTAAT